MKITEKQKEEIKYLHDKGESLREIGKKLEVCPSTISYHLNPEKRKEQSKENWGKLPKKKKKNYYARHYPKQKIIIKNYLRRKYNEDEEYREMKKKRSREYYKKNEKNKN